MTNASTPRLTPGTRVAVYGAPGTVRRICHLTGAIAVDLDGETTWHYWDRSQVVAAEASK